MKFGSKQNPIRPHSISVKTGLSVAQGAVAKVPVDVAGVYCTIRTSPALRITKSRPEPSGAQPRPVGKPRLLFRMNDVSVKFAVSTGVPRAACSTRKSAAAVSARAKKEKRMGGVEQHSITWKAAKAWAQSQITMDRAGNPPVASTAPFRQRPCKADSMIHFSSKHQPVVCAGARCLAAALLAVFLWPAQVRSALLPEAARLIQEAGNADDDRERQTALEKLAALPALDPPLRE